MKSYRIKIMSVFIAFIDHCDLIFLETAKKAFNNQIMIKETFGTLDCGTGLPQPPQTELMFLLTHLPHLLGLGHVQCSRCIPGACSSLVTSQCKLGVKVLCTSQWEPGIAVWWPREPISVQTSSPCKSETGNFFIAVSNHHWWWIMKVWSYLTLLENDFIKNITQGVKRELWKMSLLIDD